MGVSVASYWGSAKAWIAYEAQATTISEAGFADFLINGPANVLGTKAWTLSKFRQHENKAAAYGVSLIGAYEGGSHLVPPASMPGQFYRNFTWGNEGARVNTEINKALIAKYPGIVLSNFVLFGPAKGGQPWHDGTPEAPTDMSRSWDAFKRP